MRLENRRESNRQSARRYYNKKRQAIEELRAEAAALEKRLSADRPFLRYDYPLKKSEEDDAEDTIETLRRENADLRRRQDQFVAWEEHLSELTDPKSASASRLKLSLPDQPPDETKRPRIRLKTPLTGGMPRSRASVFGWTDQRRVDNGLLKFSLSKLNAYQSPELTSTAVWDLLTAPGGYDKIISQNFACAARLQVVDHSNVVMAEVYEVHSDTGGTPTVTVVRTFVLLTLFATEKGYVLLHYGLDPELATYLPDDNALVKYEWLPMLSWGAFEHVEGSAGQFLSSVVGTMRAEGANVVDWALEVLHVVLRLENILLGPQWRLLQEE